MRRSGICLPALLTICLLFSPARARGDGLIIAHGGPERPDHFSFAPLEVSFHHVNVTISGNVATTSVDQEFFNPNSSRLEGTYIFPLPEGANIDKFSMDINGQMTEAELLDAAKARQTYEEIVRRYKDPALLEYIGRGAFKVRIFPIEPGSKKRVKLSYTQILKPDSGLVEYSYPLNTEKFSARPLSDISVKITLTCDTPIKSIYSPSHEIDVKRDGDKRATIGFEAKNVRPDTDFKLIYSAETDPVGIHLLTYRNSPDDGYFLLLASPGTDVPATQVQARDVCFVLDTSGSMAGPKMEQAKKALLFCLANLNENDRFEIVRFSTEAEPLNGALVPATKDNVEKAYRFVKDLKPRGGTAIDDALRTAIDVHAKQVAIERSIARPYVVIFLTDGQPTIGQTNEDQIVSRVRQIGSTRIFSFGIGSDVNTHLLDRVANDTRAFSQYVLAEEDIEVKVSTFYSKIQSPVLADVKFAPSDGGVRLSQIYPNVMPDLFKGETLMAFGRYSGSGKAKIRLSGTLNGQGREYFADVDFAEHALKNSFIARLWATRRVGWLLDEIRLRGESAELKDEVVSLAREHGIVTPYTAYLILEDERNRNTPIAMRTMRELDDDTVVRRATAGKYANANTVRAGADAVNSAIDYGRLKAGYNLAQSAPASPAMQKQSGAPATQPGGYKVAQNYAQQVRVVNGRAFYQNGTTWTDAQAPTKLNLQKKEIAFDSEDYFALLQKYPSAASWLSLGNAIDLVLDDTLYVIR